MGTYVIGIDFGTLSGRAVVVDTEDGSIKGEAVHDYAHGVMDRQLTAGDGRDLPPGFALQDSHDYIDVLASVVPQAVTRSGVDPAQIVGLGIDATSATVVFCDAEGIPLSWKPEFANNPHAYVKLWKHHGAAAQAAKMLEVARRRQEPWLERYGSVISSELLLPKAIETYEEAPSLFDQVGAVTDLLDWITWQLTGQRFAAEGSRGFKSMFQDGSFPSPEYLNEVSPGFGDRYMKLVDAPVAHLGSSVGHLRASMARMMGLPADVVVAAGNIDAHVMVAACNAVRPGQLTAIIGTSSCYIVNAHEFHPAPGIFGAVDGGTVAGLWGYESGQTAVGDIFSWYVNNYVTGEDHDAAGAAGVSVNEWLTNKMKADAPGASGLVALDWFNGNRSTLNDATLSGMIVGQTLATPSEDVYRALLESTAFGARAIIENYVSHGIAVHDVVAGGGGLVDDAFYMQMFADVLGMPVSVSASRQSGALGAAIFGAVAAHVYPTLEAAANAMTTINQNAYLPDPERAAAYNELYAIYQDLYETFGHQKDVMHRLYALRTRNA
ncbi:MAG: ribulokinase [Actinomycetaceae bacterium]|nr:ribulokinase [Actinomycetaceae bacterium]MDY6082658.1 ribulokinase [Actinomycetaceae bacterium]